MVVAVGLTLTATLLVTAMLPGEIEPVPPVNTAVRLELAPEEIEVGLAAKLLITGTGSTVTIVVCVIGLPEAGVTVNV